MALEKKKGAKKERKQEEIYNKIQTTGERKND